MIFSEIKEMDMSSTRDALLSTPPRVGTGLGLGTSVGLTDMHRGTTSKVWGKVECLGLANAMCK